ncbi:MAG: hypothetical protein HC848_05360 [Limnobacter sp.]|nr:hypothetical protein [Limnobacter sp.]
MEALEVSEQAFRFADRHAAKARALIQHPDFDSSPAMGSLMAYEVKMMGTMWTLAANLVKELAEPLKSIVNK